MVMTVEDNVTSSDSELFSALFVISFTRAAYTREDIVSSAL